MFSEKAARSFWVGSGIRALRNRSVPFRTLRKGDVAAWCSTELAHLSFEFADVSTYADQLFRKKPTFFFESLKVVVFCPRRNFKVAVLVF